MRCAGHGLLRLKGNSTKADFKAALNMELSDGWVITENNSNFDPSARGAHTHHIALVDGRGHGRFRLEDI